MTLSDDREAPTLADIKRLFSEVLPSPADQVFVFSQLLESIAVCERAGSTAWSISLLSRGFRLNVGNVEAMTCGFTVWAPGEFGNEQEIVFVELRLLLAGEDCVKKVPKQSSVGVIGEMSYRVVGARHWCYSGTFHPGSEQGPDPNRTVVAEQLDRLRPNHHAFIELACRTPTGKLRQRSNFAQHHCEALYAYARSVVGGKVSASTRSTGQGSGSEGAPELPPLLRTRLEKAAADCGFERTPTLEGGALVLRSARFPETVSITHMVGDERFVVRPSRVELLPVADQAAGELTTDGWSALYDALDRMAATARNLPDRVAARFAQQAGELPRGTEAERLVVQRVGQDLFRAALLDFWRGRCCVTGLAVPELLRASHIKPWAQCDSDQERLDVFNGLLLAPHLDALFDGGWLSFASNGTALWSKALSPETRAILGVQSEPTLRGLLAQHQPYLAFHRRHVFRG